MAEGTSVGKNLRAVDAPEQPVIIAVSWGFVRQLSALQMRYQHYMNRDDMPFEEKLQVTENLMDQIQAAISSKIVSMPRSWLVEDAPENLDFRNDPKAIEWLRADKFEALVALAIGQKAASEAKKS